MPATWSGSLSAASRRSATSTRVLLVRDVAQQDAEFVAAQAGGEVGAAQGRPKPVGDRDEGLVAGGVTEGVVDRLEVVEVEEQGGDGPGADSLGERRLRGLHEPAPVGQTRSAGRGTPGS